MSSNAKSIQRDAQDKKASSTFSPQWNFRPVYYPISMILCIALWMVMRLTFGIPEIPTFIIMVFVVGALVFMSSDENNKVS